MANYSKAKKIAKALARLIDGYERDLLRISNRFDKKLYKRYKKLLNSLDTDDDGNILNTAKNLRKVNSSNRLTRQAFKEVADDYKKLFKGAFKKIDSENEQYYSYIVDKDIDKVSKRIARKMNTIVGVDEDNGLIPELLDPSEIARKVRSSVMNSVSSNLNLEIAENESRELIIGTKDKLGICESYYYKEGREEFTKYERTSKLAFSSALKLNYAIYQGGTIEDTRDFCTVRNGKVFNRETIESWINETWRGKKADHNIFIDAGGWNCRHYYDWITFELAKRLDPNIEESKYDK